MRFLLRLGCCLLFFIVLQSCGTAPEPREETKAGEQEQSEQENEAASAAEQKAEDTQLTSRLESYLENSLNKLDQGLIAEGIIQLVTILSEADKLSRKTSRIAELEHQAETELTKIRAGLSLNASLEWIDEDKNQINGSSIDVGSNKGLNPSIYLTFNFGAGETVVADAPILFEFVQGSGLLTSLVNTNEYGQATCSLAKLENANTENIIRASLVFRVKEYSYSFQDVIKDFVFVPPARKATILVLEKAKDTLSQDPIILDAVYNKLKGVAFDFSQYNGVLLGDNFDRVFGGDPKAIASMGIEKGVSYLVMVLNNGYYLNQVEMGGKKYNIFKSQTTATTRIIRVSDGKLMYSGSVQGVAGQGGSEQKAIIDGFRKASQEMSEKIERDLAEINEALSGTPE